MLNYIANFTLVLTVVSTFIQDMSHPVEQSIRKWYKLVSEFITQVANAHVYK